MIFGLIEPKKVWMKMKWADLDLFIYLFLRPLIALTTLGNKQLLFCNAISI